MMTDKELDKRVERAVENFMQGYGCCQSVVAAFADLYGLTIPWQRRLPLDLAVAWDAYV